MNRRWLRRLWSALSTGRQRHGHRRPTYRLHLEPLEERTLPSGVFPYVQSINRLTPTGPTTNAATVSYAVTFSEPVTGIAPTDFKLVSTGTVVTTLTQVTPVSALVYTVTVSGITGNGTLGLNLARIIHGQQRFQHKHLQAADLRQTAEKQCAFVQAGNPRKWTSHE